MTAPAERKPKLLLVDDTPQNIRVLEAMLGPRGYDLITANSGEEALRLVAAESPDLVLLDVVMPGMDGYEVCRRLRADAATQLLPVVMVTASGDQQRAAAIEIGADDFIQKPFDHAEVLARIKSLLRIKSLHETVAKQATQLEDLNRGLETRVQQQVAELERLGRLRRFLSPRLADVLVSTEGEALLENHRRQIAVVCCQLRGFAELAEVTAPEEVMSVLLEYNEVLSDAIAESEGSVGQLSADQVMIFFNDPLPVDEPASHAVNLALRIRSGLTNTLEQWRRRGLDLGFCAGIDVGYATLGMLSVAGRNEYGAIGPVVHAAARLRDAAENGQVLIGQRVQMAVEQEFECARIGERELGASGRSVAVFAVEHARATAASTEPPRTDRGPLTAREQEVVALIVNGYTNRQIAEALVVAEPTAVRHVANILNKLKLSSRAQVAVWAVEQRKVG